MESEKLYEPVCIPSGEAFIVDFDHGRMGQLERERGRFPAELRDVDLGPQEGITDDDSVPPFAYKAEVQDSVWIWPVPTTLDSVSIPHLDKYWRQKVVWKAIYRC